VPGIIPHFHSMPGERFSPKTLIWEKKLFPCSNKILFVSEPAKTQYQELFNIAPQSKAEKKLVTISNAFQLDSFYTANIDSVEKLRITYKLEKEQPVIGLVARIAPVKCIETLIDAVDILRHKIHNLRCMIVGEGEEDYVNSLKTLVAEKKLSEYFIFTGYRQDVAEHIRLFTCGVLCSSHEGLPHFLIEAFASGVPIVGSNIEGIRQVMTEGQEGLYAKVKDPQSLAQAIERIILNPELRKQMSKNAVRKSQEFDIHEHINKLCTIYDNLLSAPDNEIEKARNWFRLKYRLKL
ncbi:MAG: glycosyltransferase, partial [Candidatus Sumerlaeia bacterium]|nr:glycosyltransferase [Candidatus Sumerlaeia bacterium]